LDIIAPPNLVLVITPSSFFPSFFLLFSFSLSFFLSCFLSFLSFLSFLPVITYCFFAFPSSFSSSFCFFFSYYYSIISFYSYFLGRYNLFSYEQIGCSETHLVSFNRGYIMSWSSLGFSLSPSVLPILVSESFDVNLPIFFKYWHTCSGFFVKINRPSSSQ